MTRKQILSQYYKEALHLLSGHVGCLPVARPLTVIGQEALRFVLRAVFARAAAMLQINRTNRWMRVKNMNKI